MRIRWEDSEWKFVTTGVEAAEKLYPEATPAKLLFMAIQGLPPERRRPVVGANIFLMWSHVNSLREKMVTPLPAVPGRHVSAIQASATPVDTLLNPKPKSQQGTGISREELQVMLHNHAVEQRIFFMEQEQRLLKMMERIYHKQMKFWTGDPEFQDPLIKEDLEGVAQKLEAFQEAGLRAIGKHDPSPRGESSSHKVRVLVFGAKEDQRDLIQREVPQVRIEVAKEIKQVSGNYALVVVLKDFCRQPDKDALRVNYKDCLMEVSGMKTRAVEAIKNHLALA